ncbi:MAG: hypothetical protein QM689_02320 [Oscillospiraceae bacterium]
MEERIYIVRRIDGDYARLVNAQSGEELLVARALLPEEIDENDRLLWKDFSYTIL